MRKLQGPVDPEGTVDGHRQTLKYLGQLETKTESRRRSPRGRTRCGNGDRRRRALSDWNLAKAQESDLCQNDPKVPQVFMHYSSADMIDHNRTGQERGRVQTTMMREDCQASIHSIVPR